jgi:hypothetical protein
MNELGAVLVFLLWVWPVWLLGSWRERPKTTGGLKGVGDDARRS